MLPLHCVNVFLALFTFLLLLAGLALVAVGWIINARYYDIIYFLEIFHVAPSDIIAVFGFTIFVVAAIGCYGTYQKSAGAITTYGVCLGIISLTLWTYSSNRWAISRAALDLLHTSINRTMYDYPHNKFAAERMNAVQIHFNCCGTREAEDWVKVFGNRTIPRSCSKDEPGIFTLYTQGCYDTCSNSLDSACDIAARCSGALVYPIFAGMVAALYLAHMLRNKREKRVKNPTRPIRFRKDKRNRYYLL